MINPFELRLGNVVIFDNRPSIITCVQSHCVLINNYRGTPLVKDIRPIRLTPEIFNSIGFKIQENEKSEWDSGEPYWHDRNLEISYPYRFAGLFVRRNKYYLLGGSHPEIKSLHQLQNLYYELCGVELPVNLKTSDSDGI